MKRYVALFLFMLSVATCMAQVLGNEGTDGILSYMRNAMRFNKVLPQEKVYLHFDNTGYFEDETIWFKAYVTRTDDGGPSDLS